jgi:alkanesulfonate monooxygenase SsuD/methylene tetrahydromethanopterin reductase-like flavin-dependent oxidoreductase (luciferase family)
VTSPQPAAPVADGPFASGSVSLRLYPHLDAGLDAPAIVAELTGQAALAADAGFDGVMTSEHHGGFAGYLPNPLQAAGWCLEEMSTGWAAPCPLLLPLRPAALVAEEVAWLAARHPGRVGLGVAAGSLPQDFDAMHVPIDDLAARFTDGFEELVGILGGRAPGVLVGDPAVARCATEPIPVLSAAMGFTAARRAARLGAGLVFDSMSTPERCCELMDEFRGAGGTAPSVLIRRAWVGAPPRGNLDAQLAVYRGYAAEQAQKHWGTDELVGTDDPIAVAEGLADALARSGADAVNLRLHVPGVTPEQVREQVERLGTEVLPRLREAIAQ